MPSSGRSERSSDRTRKGKRPASRRPAAVAAPARALEPGDHLQAEGQPDAQLDAQSAEALRQIYESDETFLARQERPRRWPSPQGEPAAPSPAPAPPAAGSAWLETHLSDMARRLQAALAEFDPDRSLGSLNRRLELLEQRFGEALADVAQRSDLGALRLIEANVLELAQHMEQALGRLDGVDEQLRDLGHRMQQGDQQRLAALEKLLAAHIAEWKRSDERTASVLGTLEEAVNRVGEQVEAVEAHKPVPNLSLYTLATPGADSASGGRDPLSQAYTDAALALEQHARSSLDAADYEPRAAVAPSDRPLASLPQVEPGSVALPPLPQHGAVCEDGLPSPAARAAAMRAKLRQAGLLGDEKLDAGELSPRAAAPGKEPDRPFAWWRHRAGLLLGAGLVVFAAGGFFTVDALMTPPERDTSALSHSAQPAGSQAAAPAFAPPPGRGDTTPPDDASAASNPPDTTMRIAFQPKAAPAPPALEPAAVAPVQAEAEAQAGTAITSLPMTIGPASLRQAAMRGEAAAQLEIAARFAAGAGVPRDMAEAVRWYGRAAAQGLASAQYRLAMLYERGWGTPPDAERARVWYGRAAEQGHVKAMHNLAVLSVGGARSDYATAAKWFAKAADMGLADSQFNLAVLHQTGLGVPKDLRLAYKWLALAARGGDREAATRLAEVKARMAPADVQEAEAQIAVWRARTPDPAVNEPVGLSPVP